jgi:hypothetical protein
MQPRGAGNYFSGPVIGLSDGRIQGRRRTKMPSRLSRRTLLRGVGGVALALPFLDAMRPAQGQTIQRYVQLFTPLGFSPGQWYTPSGGEGFSLREFASSLSAHASDMLIVRGLRGWNGADGHHAGVGAVFTGRGEDEGYGISLDQEIAGLLAHDRFRSLHFGCFTSSSTSNPGETQTVFTGPNRPVVPEADPRVVFRTMFGGSLPTGGESIDEAHARRRSILDLVRADFRDIEVGLSASDRQRLRDHAEYLRSIETSIASMGAECGSLDPAAFELDPSSVPGDRLSRAQASLLALSLACDLTRVATMQWSYSVGGVLYTWLEGRMPGIGAQTHHGFTHSPSTGDWSEGLPFFRTIERWYMEEVGFVIDELKRLGVFDDTLVLWGTNESRGQHGADEEGRDDRTHVIFGSLGGLYRTGRVVDFQVDGYLAPERRFDYSPALLLNIAQAYGYTGETFGDAYRNQAGAMPNLRAS